MRAFGPDAVCRAGRAARTRVFGVGKAGPGAARGGGGGRRHGHDRPRALGGERIEPRTIVGREARTKRCPRSVGASRWLSLIASGWPAGSPSQVEPPGPALPVRCYLSGLWRPFSTHRAWVPLHKTGPSTGVSRYRNEPNAVLCRRGPTAVRVTQFVSPRRSHYC